MRQQLLEGGHTFGAPPPLAAAAAKTIPLSCAFAARPRDSQEGYRHYPSVMNPAAPQPAGAPVGPFPNESATLRDTLTTWRGEIARQARDFLEQAKKVAKYDEEVRNARLDLFDLNEETNELEKDTSLLEEKLEGITKRHNEMERDLDRVERLMDERFPQNSADDSQQSRMYWAAAAHGGYRTDLPSHSSRLEAYTAAQQVNSILGSLEDQLRSVEAKIQEGQEGGAAGNDDVRRGRRRRGAAARSRRRHVDSHANVSLTPTSPNTRTRATPQLRS